MPPDSPPAASDEFLIASMLGGDWAALNKLIERYDGLVRFTIFRKSKTKCRKDPQWLESIASATWTGFVKSMQRGSGDRPRSLRAYLTAVAKYQVASALRGAPGPDDGAQSIDSITTEIASPLDDPANTLSHLELLQTMRECLAQLGDDDRTLATQLTAITERRWRDAAAALGMSESTLRSRWKRTLDRLRECVEGKTGVPIAPKPADDDSLG